MIVNCKECGKEFKTIPSRVKDGRGKYCSKECSNKHTLIKKGEHRGVQFAKGHQTWCKGLKGIHLSPKTEFKKGNIPWCRGKKRQEMANENHWFWKEDAESVSYVGMHMWVKRNKESDGVCLNCGSTKRLHWANKDHTYRRNLDDYVLLCAKCHKNYDVGNYTLEHLFI
jgi:hypothetical protein